MILAVEFGSEGDSGAYDEMHFDIVDGGESAGEVQCAAEEALASARNRPSAGVILLFMVGSCRENSYYRTVVRAASRPLCSILS